MAAKSNLKNMVLCLFGTTLICSSVLAGVYAVEAIHAPAVIYLVVVHVNARRFAIPRYCRKAGKFPMPSLVR